MHNLLKGIDHFHPKLTGMKEKDNTKWCECELAQPLEWAHNESFLNTITFIKDVPSGNLTVVHFSLLTSRLLKRYVRLLAH
jgi:hypothetical protein